MTSNGAALSSTKPKAPPKPLISTDRPASEMFMIVRSSLRIAILILESTMGISLFEQTYNIFLNNS